MPTNDKLRKTLEKEYNGTTSSSTAAKFQREASEIILFQGKQERQVNDLVKDWSSGGHGWVPMKKTYDTVHLVFENWNNLKFWTQKNRNRIRSIDNTRKILNADILAGVESQVDWTQANGENRFVTFCE